MNDIAIVGVGLVDSLGIDPYLNWTRYINGISPMSVITNFDTSLYPVLKVKNVFEIDDSKVPLTYLDSNEIKNLDRYSKIGLYSAYQAVLDSNIAGKENTAVIYGSLAGPQKLILENVTKLLGNKKISPRQALAAQRDSLGYLICKKFGFKGINLSMTSACATGIVIIDYAVKLLQLDVYDNILVGACDVMVDPIDIFMFQCIGALDIREVPCSSPFDKTRNGFMMGEGSASFVLKKLDKAIKDKNKIYGIIKGIGFSTELYHETGMDPEASGAKTSVNMALDNSKIYSNEIGIVSCHATSTPNGDQSEFEIISEFFPEAHLMALKGNIGHTMSACGLVELCYMIYSMKYNKIGPIANLVSPLDNLIISKKKESNFKYGIKNSFGFGGKCAALVLEKYD
jgi:3-oxoacyl-[acyl-carrier-protein] synthase II